MSAMGRALLFDARDLHPCGTVSTTASETGFAPDADSTTRSQNLRVDAQVDAVAKLKGQVDGMLTRLRTELQEKELRALRTEAAARGAPASAAAKPSGGQKQAGSGS